jgi:hypothetical protein
MSLVLKSETTVTVVFWNLKWQARADHRRVCLFRDSAVAMDSWSEIVCFTNDRTGRELPYTQNDSNIQPEAILTKARTLMRYHDKIL